MELACPRCGAADPAECRHCGATGCGGVNAPDPADGTAPGPGRTGWLGHSTARLAGAGLLVLAGLLVGRSWGLVWYGQVTTGEVVMTFSRNWYVNYSVDGKVYSFSVRSPPGDRVRVRYWPHDPANGWIDDWPMMWAWPAAAAVFGVAVLSAGAPRAPISAPHPTTATQSAA
jgi:hypothetical protein